MYLYNSATRKRELFTPNHEDIVKMYYAELEKEINETPHNWLWSHKRWK